MSESSVSKGRLWTGRVLQWLIGLSTVVAGVMNLSGAQFAIDNAVSVGYQEKVVAPFGVILLVIGVLYVIPRTAVLGVILLTAWYGGAVATHVLHDDPLGVSMFAVVYGVVAWAALWLQNRQVANLIPLQK